MRHAEDGIHRRTDFVAHVGEEFGLGARSGLGQRVCAPQFVDRGAFDGNVFEHDDDALGEIVGVDGTCRQADPERAAVLAPALAFIDVALVAAKRPV